MSKHTYVFLEAGRVVGVYEPTGDSTQPAKEALRYRDLIHPQATVAIVLGYEDAVAVRLNTDPVGQQQALQS